MAVVDKKIFRKVCLDDTEALTIAIENAQTVSGHTEYIIRVQRGPQPEHHWVICKRYSDFVALHSVFQGSGINLLLPPKKIIGNMDRTFIAQRQMELQNYLKAVLMNPILATSLAVKRFLDPYSYAISLQELALQHVSMALRSEIKYELLKPMTDMGWRFRKHYFLVKSKLRPKVELLLQWVEYGPDKYLDDKEIQNVLKALVNLNHPHIENFEQTYCGDGGCFIIRELHQYGTLKDLIYGAKPKSPYLKKYGNIKNTKPLSLNDIVIYGRQIIETLIFLHEKDIPFGHLHLGNILIDNNNIKLLDIENTILGLPSFYRPFFVQHKKINTMQSIDVYSLGHVLFEMAFGYPLNEAVCDNVPSCPSSLGILLESILSTESIKAGLPSLNDLIQHPFFNVGVVDNFIKINLKFTSSLRQSLHAAVKLKEKRLQNDQKAIRHQKKIVKMQELLLSEPDPTTRKIRQGSDQKNLKAGNDNTDDKKSPRSGSLTSSNSTAASTEATTPPLPVAKTPPPCPTGSAINAEGRAALLDSICAFNKSLLRHQPTTLFNGS